VIDKHGRRVRAGDILKIFHFVAARKRNVFMYKLVCRVGSDLRVCDSGDYLFAVDIVDIQKSGDLQKAHKCPISALDPETLEIISGRFENGLCWWERDLDREEMKQWPT